MMSQLSHRLAVSLRQEDLARAESRRLRRSVRTGGAGSPPSGIRDAIGQRLIALGNRMVSEDGSDHFHRRAAA